MTTLTAQAYLDQESATLAKVSRAGANALRLEAKVLTEVYADRHTALVNGLTLDPKNPLDTTMTYLRSLHERRQVVEAELKDPEALINPRLHMRADRIFRIYETMLATEYEVKAAELNIEQEANMRRMLQSGLMPTENAVAYGAPDFDADIMAAQAELPDWATTTPDHLIEHITMTAIDDDFDFSRKVPLAQRVQDVTDVDPVTTSILKSIQAATSPFPTLDRDTPVAQPYVSPTIKLAEVKQEAKPVVPPMADFLKHHEARIVDRVATLNGPELQKYVQEMLQTRLRGAMTELDRSAKTGINRGTPELDAQNEALLDHTIFLRGQIKIAQEKLKPAPVAAPAPALPADAIAAMATASIANREKLAEIKPERKGFFGRMKDAAAAGAKFISGVTDTVLNAVQTHGRGFAAAAGLAAVVGAGTAAVLNNDTATSPGITGLAKNALAAKAEAQPNPRFSSGVVTPFVAPAPVATPQIIVTEPAPAVEAVKAAAPVAKHFAKVQVDQPRPAYQMPESLKVTFNDGTTSQFDKTTWSKACAQTGAQTEICQGLAPKNV